MLHGNTIKKHIEQSEFLSAGLNVELADTDRNGILLPQPEDELQKIECHVGLFGAPTTQVESDNGIAVLNNNVAIIDGAQHWLIADGNIGTAMAISFDPTKNLNASGNGGAIVTNNEALYEFASQWRDNGKPHHFYSKYITICHCLNIQLQIT